MRSTKHKTLDTFVALAIALGLGACSDGNDQGDMFGDGNGDGADDGGPGDDGGDDGSGGDDGGDDGTDGDDGGGVKYDVDEGTGGGGDNEAGCEKIDFLFIIDNSGSMSPHQQNLINNFGPFIDTIDQEVQGKDWQIMLVDTDACPNMNGNCMPTSCEEELGAGQVRNCGIPADTRYMDSSLDIATIKSNFQCAGVVGDQGSAEELPMSAMMEVLGPQNEANGCNPGFIRDDAVLVVTFITDDHIGWFGNDDVNNRGNPMEWFNAVIGKKAKVENVVMLGLVALLSDQSCIGFGPQEATRFVEFVDMFADHGLIGSVCNPDYNAFFQDAVGLIDTTCDEFVPEG